MDIVRRVQDILLKPKETWAVIDTEPTDTGRLFTQYLMILAAIPAVAMFIGLSLFGVGGFGFSMRVPIVWGLTQAILSYVLSLVMVYVMALIVDALAPTFGGQKNRLQALKLVVYAFTASMIAGISYLLPSLAMLVGLLGFLYTVYLFYLGLPVLMKCPQDKAVGYTVVVGLVGLVAGMVIGAITGAVTGAISGPGMMSGAGAGGGAISINTPKGEVTLDTRQMEAAAKQMEAVAKQMEQAATGMQQQAAAGSVSPQQLKGFLPEALGELKRETIEAIGDGQAIVSTVNATYRSGERHVQLSITDVGGGLGAAAAMWAMVQMDRETGDEVEKIYKQGKRSVHEKYRKADGDVEYQVILGNGVMVSADANGMDLNTVKAAVASMNLDAIEGLQRPAKP